MTTIGPTLVITGEVESDEDITIEGRVNGHVTVRDATLAIGSQADIEADLRGTRVVVAGRLRGSISASERIELTATARVDGSLSADRIVIIEGAHFNGGIDMARRTIAAKMAQYKAEHAAAAPVAP